MTERKHEPPETKRRFGTIWGELAYVCKKTHYWLHVRKDKTSASRFLRRLKGILEQLPENDKAIIRAEGWALFHELKGDKSSAVKYRRRELELLQELYRETRSTRYNEADRKYMLAGRDITVFQERQEILRALEEDPKGEKTKGH